MAKKAATKKATAKKSPAKKTTVKKAVKAAAKPKKTAAKKTTAKKTAAPKTAKKSAVKKSTVAKTTSTKKAPAAKKTTVAKPKTKSAKVKSEIIEVIPAPKPKPIHKIKGYSKDELEHFKKIILEKRGEIIEQLQNLREQMMDTSTGEYINENSPYSLHMAEQGTDAMEREKTFLYAQRENKFLGYLEDALKRIELGTYGICIECIDEPQNLCDTCPLIPKARLEAVPHSQLCVQIKLKQEKK